MTLPASLGPSLVESYLQFIHDSCAVGEQGALADYIPELTRVDPNGFGLSMAVHELATNASKHGSLSETSGRVDLTWSVARTQQGLTLMLDWKESRGPAPKKQRRPGFGSRLINMVIERQLNGQVEQSFGPEGLQTRLVVPLTHERWRSSRIISSWRWSSCRRWIAPATTLATAARNETS